MKTSVRQEVAAMRLAHQAHDGEVRFDGSPAISHPLTVAVNFTGPARIVAILHDVVEDSIVTVGRIRSEFDDEIADAVDAISRREGETYATYINRVATNPMARRVKLADLQHNLSTLPSGHGLAKRYWRARRVLRLATKEDIPQ